jgi:hypothetical protein
MFVVKFVVFIEKLDVGESVRFSESSPFSVLEPYCFLPSPLSLNFMSENRVSTPLLFRARKPFPR